MPDLFLLERCERIPAPLEGRRAPEGLLAPMILRNAIAGSRQREVLPCLDSRTRYWRYYLLFGRTPRWHSAVLARRLWRVVRLDASGGGRPRGLGRRLYDRQQARAGGTRLPARTARKIGESARRQYSAANRRFWELAEQVNRLGVLSVASENTRRPDAANDFFAEYPKGGEGHAANAFAAVLRAQSAAAGELANLLLRHDSVAEAVAHVGWSTIRHGDGPRLVLAWALLWALFQVTGEVDDEPTDDQADDDREPLPNAAEMESAAKVALMYLAKGIGGLEATHARMISQRLRDALAHGVYRPPVKVEARTDAGTRRRLSADLRLTAFQRLLHATHA